MSIFTINKKPVNSVQEAVAGFTYVLDGLTTRQQKIADKAKEELDILQAKVDNQTEIKVNAEREVADAAIASRNLVDMLTKGTSQGEV
jgi:hypothetical protein